MTGQHDPPRRMFTMLPEEIPLTAKRELLQQVAGLIDWRPLREQVRPYFAKKGRPSIDPVVMVKMMLAGYLFGIPSDRRLVEECSDSFALREFLGYELDEKLPTHATFTHWRQRLGAAFFRGLLHDVIRQLAALGLEFSPARSIDATSVKAQASKQGPVVERPSEVAVEQFVADYFAGDPPPPEADDPPPPQAEAPTAAQGEPAPTTPLNLHDPQARLQRKRGERAEFRYHASFSADVATGLITDAVATPLEQAETAVEHVTHDPLGVTEVVADGKYDHGATLAALQAQGVTTYVPKTSHDKPGQLSKDEFTYQPATDSYLCPQGHLLQHSRFDPQKQLHFYTARSSACGHCPRRAGCTSAKRRVVTRTETEGAREQAVRAGPRYQALQRARRVNEHLHMLGKRDHNLRRARARGLEAMGIQVALTALAINLKKAIRLGYGGSPVHFVLHAVRHFVRRAWPRGRAPLWRLTGACPHSRQGAS
jgi:transposase